MPNPGTLQNEINRLRALIKQKAEQKIDIADLISETLEAHMRHLRSEMEKFQRELEQNGDYERVAGRVGEQVAFKQSPYETHYVLGTVVAYRSDMGQYDVRDADDADGGGVYPLNETLVSRHTEAPIPCWFRDVFLCHWVMRR